MTTKKKPTASAVKESKFTKEMLVNSKRFRKNRDLVSAILEDGVEYDIEEVEAMVAKYMKGTVK